MLRDKRKQRNGVVRSRKLFGSRLRVETLEERIVLSHTTGHDPPGQGGGGGGGGDDPALFSFESALRIGDTGSDFASAVSVNQQDGSYVVAGSFEGTIDLDPSSSHVANPDLLTSAGGRNIFLAEYAADGTFLWARRPGGSYNNLFSAPATAIDSAGNIYLTGEFTGTIILDNDTSYQGVTNNLLAKYDADGSLLWARALGGDAGRVEGRELAVDDQGVYLTGAFRYTADFDLDNVHPGDVDVLTSNGQRDVFVAKYEAAGGAFDWIETRGSSLADDTGWGIALSNGSVFVSGNVTVTSRHDEEAFVWKLRATDGADDEATGIGWYRQTESDLNDGWDGALGRDVLVDNNGNVWSSGNFAGGTDFDPGDPSTPSALTTLQGRSGVGSDAFVWKLSAENGDHLWVGAVGGSASDDATAIATDIDGNIYVTGGIEGAADLDPGTGKTDTFKLGRKDSERAFVLKLNHEGDFVWAAEMGDDETTGIDIAVTTGSHPNVLAVGGFLSEGDFGGTTLISAGFADGYLVQLSQPQPAALVSLSTSTQLLATAKRDKPSGGGGGGGGNSGDPSYTIMALGSLGGGRSQANDISDAGQVVGWTTLPGDEISVPFLINPVVDAATGELTWFQDADADGTNDLMIPLGTFGGINSYASGINEKGQIVGASQDADFDYRVFIVNPLDTDEDGAPDTWRQMSGDRNELMLDLGLGQANAINNSGQIAGFQGSFGPGSATAFVIDPIDVDSDGLLDWNFPAGSDTNPLMIDLKLGGVGPSGAFDINDAGQIVGDRTTISCCIPDQGYVITPETSGPDGDSRWVRDTDGDGFNDLAVVLADAIGGSSSNARAISNLGVIAGVARFGSGGSDSDESHAATWELDSTTGEPVVTDLGLLKKGDDWSTAQHVNDHGVVVGFSYVLTGANNQHWQQRREPFLTVDGEMRSLESLATDMGGLEDVDEVSAINNAGYLVGSEADDAWYADPIGFIAIPGQTTANLQSAVTMSPDDPAIARTSSQDTSAVAQQAAYFLNYQQAADSMLAGSPQKGETPAGLPLWAIDLIFASLAEG